VSTNPRAAHLSLERLSPTHAGKMDEAKVELAEARRLNPAITVK
jgi:hypothetical protein